ncbi:MAG TPA: helix-turn-helix transcriptional regulator [Prosthecobacter sp.]|nr:helix-turn-helix transcriptional regulator [Prosthecobacter sp.]HRK15790.1 helix-turn-helix transcriptional regulator [Prosthecobacter sp.]
MDAKKTLGKAIRQLREALMLSQEKLAENAGITYQYLSAVENGRENFTIGILESLAGALGTSTASLVAHAFNPNPEPPPKVARPFFIKDASLPPGLTFQDLEKALNETQGVIRMINATLIQVTARPLSAYIQRNNFSGIVSNILCDSFSRFTPFKHNHDQRYPDLIHKTPDGEKVGLEVKSTIRPGKGGESHNGHSGWHVVACFSLDETNGEIEFVHVMFADLIGHGKARADWKYVGSNVNADTGSQRTETYTTTPAGTAKLRHGTVYLNSKKISIARWRTDKSIPAPPSSPFRGR